MGDAVNRSNSIIWFGKHSLDTWNLVLPCLMWKEWNSLTFEDNERSLDQLQFLLICTLFDWSWAWGFMHFTSIFEFQNSFRSSV